MALIKAGDLLRHTDSKEKGVAGEGWYISLTKFVDITWEEGAHTIDEGTTWAATGFFEHYCMHCDSNDVTVEEKEVVCLSCSKKTGRGYTEQDCGKLFPVSTSS